VVTISTRRYLAVGSSLLIGGGLTGIGMGVAQATSGGGCTTEHYEWVGPILLASFSPEYDTGIEIPAADGVTVRVVEATYIASNTYPEDPTHTRANDDQPRESFALFVGETQVGELTPDLPDTIEEGAPTEWFSGDQSGSFGPAVVSGGKVLFKHSSLFGFTETPNSLEPRLLTIDVERCAPPPETTLPVEETTTTVAATTVVVEPPTTAPPPTTVAAETTVAPTTQPSVATTAPATTAPPILVATGRTSGWIVGAGAASLLSGLTLLKVRRRPAH
jgi:hypothetical protein